jgi:hypothetical protein
MVTRRRILVCVQLVVLLLMVGAMAPVSADTPIPDNKVPPEVERTARHLTHDLEQQGYEVARGYFELYTTDLCRYSYEVLHSCLGNNPAAPYVIPIVPAWPDEWVDPATHDMVGPTKEGTNASYRFDRREAIVILGLLPPPARYFGLQTYLVSSLGKWKKNSDQYQFVRDYIPAMFTTLFSTLPKNPERLQLFADLSEPINNVMIQNGSRPVWDQVRYFVSTPDKTMDGAVRQALARLGIPDNTVFTEQIPSKLGKTNLRIGLDEQSDDFMTLIRYAMPDDGGKQGTPSDAWRHDLPLVVLRIRDTRPPRGPQSYPWAAFEPRYGTTPPETSLKDDLYTLARAVCSTWDQPCDDPDDLARMQMLNMTASSLKMTGPECVQVGLNCLAVTEDTVYFMSRRLPLPDDQVYALVGALGTQTGNATYVGLGLNSSLTKLGFANIDDDTLKDTANRYRDVPNHELFFLQYFARDCERIKALTRGSHCYPIDDQLPYCPDPDDFTCAELVLSLRDYLLPNSQRGPAPELTLSPLFIPLQTPQETE